jgi:L-seryl-tRNA(Ser) seleniumtransferase
MLGMPASEIESRARRVIGSGGRQGRLRFEIVDGVSTVGGGSAPGSALPTRLIAITSASESADALLARLRRTEPPVIARIDEDRVVLDLRTVLPEEDDILTQLLGELGAA